MSGLFYSHVRFTIPCILALALLLTTPSQPAEAKPAKMLDIADTIATNRILTKMASLIAGADQATFLSSKGPFTFFAPTDSAFSKLPPGVLDELLQPQNKERLQHIVLFHIVFGKKWLAKDLIPVPSLISCEGNPLPLKTSKSGTQYVLKAKIVHGDIKCENGVIHEIDTVLMPPESAMPPLSSTPPPPEPSTNAAPGTNTAPVNAPAPAGANAVPLAPIAPVAKPETTTH